MPGGTSLNVTFVATITCNKLQHVCADFTTGLVRCYLCGEVFRGELLTLYNRRLTSEKGGAYSRCHRYINCARHRRLHPVFSFIEATIYSNRCHFGAAEAQLNIASFAA